ncbi:hypothetical protein AAE478_007069 [Parahypoxylon ruwenzoriense]
MVYPYHSDASYGYSSQTYWPTGTAMTRDISHGSDYSGYSASTSGSSNGQYDTGLSPSSETMGTYDLLGAVDGTSSLVVNEQTYGVGNRGEESEFPYQFYDFITGDESGQGPYWRLKPGYTPSTMLPGVTPVDISPEVPRSASDASGRHVCLEPFCNASPFKRKADLQRHYLHRHRGADQKKPFPCDWKKCQRSREPFFRLDHCREHYRDYHMEDILRRGPNREESSGWWSSRNVDARWWRCTKCLARIAIGSQGFDCPKCKTTCEAERRKLRGYD